MKKLSVSVIVPNFNGASLLSENLPSLLKAKSNSKNNILEVIVVDDGSKDESVSILSKEFPEARVIKHKVNRGFPATVNTGVRSSKGNLILLLNSDVSVTKNFLESAVELFKDPKVFGVSLHEKGYGPSRGYFSEGFIQLGQYKESNDPQPTFHVSGGSGLFDREKWMELSGMDEKLFTPFYWEDIDLCYRAWKRGYINLWDPKSNVTHKHKSTTNTLSERYVVRIRERNQLLMIWKDIHSKTLFQKHLLGIGLRVLRHPGYLRVIVMALLKLGFIFKARKKEMKEAWLSDEAVLEKFHQHASLHGKG